MIYKFILTFSLCSFFLPSFGQNKIKWVSSEMMEEKIQKANRKFLVYFYYDGCKWCKYMEETTLDNGQIAKFMNQNYYAFKVNALSTTKTVFAGKPYTSIHIGKYDFNELAVDLLGGEMSFPAIVILDEKFHKIQAFNEVIELPNFEMLLSYYAGNYHKNTLWRRFTNTYCKESHFNSLVNEGN